MEVIELPVEHIEAKPVDNNEAEYWNNLADEVCHTHVKVFLGALDNAAA